MADGYGGVPQPVTPIDGEACSGLKPEAAPDGVAGSGADTGEGLRVLVVTWNVGGHASDPRTAAHLIARSSAASHDLVCICLQELIQGMRLLKGLLSDWELHEALRAWAYHFQQVLGPPTPSGGGFQLLAEDAVAGCGLLLFGRHGSTLGPAMTDTCRCSAAGAGGTVNLNKGAACAVVQLPHGLGSCGFIGSHFTSGNFTPETSEARCQDYYQVMRDLQPVSRTAQIARESVSKSNANGTWQQPALIGLELLKYALALPMGTSELHRMDLLFFAGDLNVRLRLPQDEANISQVLSALSTSRAGTAPEVLLARDELGWWRRSALAFETEAGWQEAPVRFPPSYKLAKKAPLVVPGRPGYDATRLPAWCDRVLWRAPGTSVQVLEYSSEAIPQVSDHAPVWLSLLVLPPASSRRVAGGYGSAPARQPAAEQHRPGVTPAPSAAPAADMELLLADGSWRACRVVDRRPGPGGTFEFHLERCPPAPEPHFSTWVNIVDRDRTWREAR